ncbi:HAMP domain-containing sensor histidine kinase [Streptomyces sp. B1866]|uniref:HAMP domain-containing sensor histidine kinase n=1 Tax=Streptomyces sp. B1866 TaxID=3075431 RepID=UPI00288D52BB|nr:HAMP domain-containing sensor histidine kinase [Streptomyces sp. B1866]MDT3400348.1 HAMP domain-containing sensor histidine kinase [Streptomyces sp. B1866]
MQRLSLRLRLVLVFALVALAAAVSASAIAYWLNRDAVLTRTQNAALDEFRDSLKEDTDALPAAPSCPALQDAADRMARTTQKFQVVLTARDADGRPCMVSSDAEEFPFDAVPKALRRAVDERRDTGGRGGAPYHVYWQRVTRDGTPYLVGGARMVGGGPTGYLLKSLENERQDLESLAWSLGIATALALVGSALLAQAAASTVLRPVQRLGEAAKRLGEGQLDTRLHVSGSDELANLSQTFNQTAERLERRVAELSARESASRRFVADMSHELRTPLTAITAVTEVLEEEVGSLDPMIAPAVQLVVSETRRLNDLVENLMEVTRFDAGTARLVLDDVDVADQVTACLDVRAWMDAVELDAPRGIVARLDPRRLDVILANLIGNAIKHGGSPVRVSVRIDVHTDELVVRVRDHGPGIPQDVLPHVFDRFYKASASRPRSEGSGLGLSIARENAHIHGGDITASNDPEGGAVFTLRLPMDASPLAAGEDGAGRDRTGDGARQTGSGGAGGSLASGGSGAGSGGSGGAGGSGAAGAPSGDAGGAGGSGTGAGGGDGAADGNHGEREASAR